MALPNVMVIQSADPNEKGYVYRKDEDGIVAFGEESVFSTRARIEVEPAKTDSKYVNLRFSYSNRYMQRPVFLSYGLAAVGLAPLEDTSSPFCTLFEPVKVDNGDDDDDVFYFIHAESGGRLAIDIANMSFFVDIFGTSASQGHLRVVDLDSLVRLPVRGNLAFIGDNGKYLKAFTWFINYFQLSSDIPNDTLSRHQVTEQPDGHVRLTSIHWSALWNLANSGWILGNTTNANSPNTLFWPVKINGNTIALRAADGKFCQRRVTNNLANGSIGTEVSSLTKQAELQVEELVAKSLVHNVRYQVEYGRIFDETSYTGWSSTVVNSQDVEVTISLSFSYQDTKEYTFARSYTLETGVPTLFDSALPFVSKDGSIDDAAAKISALLQWNAANTMTATVTGKGSVTLPAKTSAVVSYVGKRGTCNVPFYYTQADTVVNAPIGSLPVEVVSEGIDGLYTATNTYDFNLVIEKTHAI
ncbi:hypothetical protein AAHA92_12568 [Salvia divinorum]|uniref:Agglutinin domain-containing protein n=1 Tax=Salvia divinorum TaxID=28513 RepID=A0ABD1HL38_SALDI